MELERQSSSLALLYLETDPIVREQVSTYVEGYGFSVVRVDTTNQARELLKAHHFDMLLLDLRPADEDGFRLIHEVSSHGRAAIVVTSVIAEEADRILALEAGADTYLVKPVGLRDLVAHLRAVARRVQSRRAPAPSRRTAHFDGWSIDLSAHRAQSANRSVELTSGETAILRVLLERPLHVLSRPELLASTRRDDSEVFDRTVDVLVSRLRHKLESDPAHPVFIQTIRGEGYCFSEAVTWQAH